MGRGLAKERQLNMTVILCTLVMAHASACCLLARRHMLGLLVGVEVPGHGVRGVDRARRITSLTLIC